MCRDETRTHQSFKEECDINTIMRKYERGQLIEHVNRYQGDYGDYTNVPQDYAACLAQVADAGEMFQTIPAAIRERFGNDPGRFLAFAEDPANAESMVQLGLAVVHPGRQATAGGGEGVDAPPSEKIEKTPQASDKPA